MDGSQKEGGNFLIYFRKRGVPKKGGFLRKGAGGSIPVGIVFETHFELIIGLVLGWLFFIYSFIENSD